jgi:PAS domain S-box-containing protein
VSQHDLEMPSDLAFLVGGGDMGQRIRAFRWDTTPLGDPRDWSLPLRTAVRILLTTNHPVFIFWGRELICLYNDAYARSLGPEKHPSILGARGRDAWEEIWPIIGPQIELVLSGRGATWQENQLVPIIRHGRREDVYWTYGYSPIDDPAAPAGVGGVLVLCTETTEQVLSAERLRAADGRWRQLFEQAPAFMCVLSGPKHVFEFANPGYFRLVGRDDILGRSVRDVLPWASTQGFVALLDSVFTEGKPVFGRSAEMVIPGPAGQPDIVRYLDFVYQPIRDERGLVNGIFVLGSDVTERNQAAQALKESEQRLRIACEAAALGIHDYDVATGLVQWDSRIRELWGVGGDEVITYEVFAAGLHPEDRATTQASIDRALDPDGPGRFFAEYRVINRTSTETRWVQATGNVTFVGRQPVRLVGTVLDITEQKLADARRDEFLATLSHELRNPLAPIGSAVDLLTRHPPAEPQAAEAHRVIGRQLKILSRLLEDLLDLVRISRGRIEIRKEFVPLQDIFQQVRETVATQLQQGGCQLVVNVPPEPVHVCGDRVRLAQVFSNLVVNACKYSEAGSTIDVDVVVPSASEVVVTVVDEGIGIAEDYLPRVFDSFSQAQSSLHRSKGGLGIGLSLARGLLLLHDGSITAHSEGLGRGSTFVVRLPVVAPPSTGAEAAPVDAVASPVAALRILLVDDNEDAAAMLSALLSLDGAEVTVAADGVQAVGIAEHIRPDLVLLDLGLPGLNGYDVCRGIRRQPWAGNTKLVALTGWGQASDRAKTTQAGFDAHLVKPVEYSELLSAVRTLGSII